MTSDMGKARWKRGGNAGDYSEGCGAGVPIVEPPFGTSQIGPIGDKQRGFRGQTSHVRAWGQVGRDDVAGIPVPITRRIVAKRPSLSIRHVDSEQAARGPLARLALIADNWGCFGRNVMRAGSRLVGGIEDLP